MRYKETEAVWLCAMASNALSFTGGRVALEGGLVAQLPALALHIDLDGLLPLLIRPCTYGYEGWRNKRREDRVPRGGRWVGQTILSEWVRGTITISLPD